MQTKKQSVAREVNSRRHHILYPNLIASHAQLKCNKQSSIIANRTPLITVLSLYIKSMYQGKELRALEKVASVHANRKANSIPSITENCANFNNAWKFN